MRLIPLASLLWNLADEHLKNRKQDLSKIMTGKYGLNRDLQLAIMYVSAVLQSQKHQQHKW